jgi:hypothetical protein
MSENMMSQPQAGLLNEAAAAAWLSVAPSTLQAWRLERADGPPHVRLGERRIAYRPEDLEAWIRSARRRWRADHNRNVKNRRPEVSEPAAKRRRQPWQGECCLARSVDGF